MQRLAVITAAALMLPIVANAEDLPRALSQFAANTQYSAATPSSASAAQPSIKHRISTHRISKRSLDAKERRETEALNRLQAAGYGDFSNVTPDGRAFRATVTMDGQPMVVRVDPDSGAVTAVR